MTSTDGHFPDVRDPLAIDQLDRAGAGTAQRIDYDEMLAEAHLSADAPSAGQADQSAEPKLAAYPEEEADTVMHWNPYFVDNQPTAGEHPVPSSSDDELQMAWDWDLDGLHSQRIS
jgi:hypothetical protein